MPRGGGCTMAHGGGDWEDWRRQWHMAAALCHAVARLGRAMVATAAAARQCTARLAA
jgi:hypothetical protein